MSKKPYCKTHYSYEKQLEKLISRGMIVKDSKAAIQILQHTNYYRLGIYWHSFESNHDTHELKPGTDFVDVIALYRFDKKLRGLVLNAIEEFEISIRAQWAYHMSKAYGPHAHLVDKAHRRSFGTKKRDLWKKNLDALHKALKRSDESFIKRQLKKYSNVTPPIWVVSEVMSFSLLSKWFHCLRVSGLRKKIAKIYGVHPTFLESWLHHLTVVRNNCAHHSRLWNRKFNRTSPKKPQNHKVITPDDFVPDHQSFNTFTIILYLSDIISPQHSLRKKFIALVQEYSSVPLGDMGFPEDWHQRPIWKRKQG